MTHQEIERKIQLLSETYNPFSLHSFNCKVGEDRVEFYVIGHDETYTFYLGVSPTNHQLYKYIEWQIGLDEDNDPKMDHRVETVKDFFDVGYTGQKYVEA